MALVAALAGDAELLLLDERPAGLDPLMEELFADCVRAERYAGRSVLLSSHILSEVASLCDRVSIIRDGRNVETGTSRGDAAPFTATSVDATLASAVPPSRPVWLELLTAAFLASELGPLIDLPAAVQNLSPFTYLPHLPGSEVTIGPLLGLAAVALVLTTFGLGALRRRDVPAG